MNLEKHGRQALLSWLFVRALVALAAVVAVLQYRWIGEVSRAERERLRATLRSNLHRLSQDFNAEINADVAALVPRNTASSQKSREEAYANRYGQWRESSRHNRLFRRVLLAVPQDNSLVLRDLDFSRMTFHTVEWPQEWSTVRERLAGKLNGGMGGPVTDDQPALIEIPEFGFREAFAGPPWRELDWLILAVDLDYVRSTLLHDLLQRYLGTGQTLDYQAEVVMTGSPGTVIYRSGNFSGLGEQPDASVRLFDVQALQFRAARPAGPGPGPGRFGGPRPFATPFPTRHEGGLRGHMNRPPEMDGGDRGRWVLAVRHRAGSLEAAVARTRWRNLGVSGAILVLMMAAMAALVLVGRRAQRFAELQMEFVAGVSHELRTPLSVICTAG